MLLPSERAPPGPRLASPCACEQHVRRMRHATHESATLIRGAAFGLGAAALFGLSAPIAKRLLTDAQPLVLAGLLYVGGGISLSLLGVTRRLRGRGRAEAPLERRDLPAIAAVVLVGGVAGPLLMLTASRAFREWSALCCSTWRDR